MAGCRARNGGRAGGWGIAAALALAVGLAAPAAHAQLIGGANNAASAPLFKGGKAAATANAPAPPPTALPGARASQTVAPATVNPASMDPTAALFDAINRDDLAAARDALNRGAALQGTNVLGMTPLQLSIDLGRNDITFVLLSMQAGDETEPPAAARLAQASGPAAAPPRHGAAAARPALARRTRAAPPAAAPAPVPVRFAGNGGTPVPAAGFLGFDPGH